ncbi:hypothetical protein [Paenibacillus cymbidii]|uniref:hypothetical protein n=1 Tax=Paenibacillus cymbidii TaxID=1639034 RepID=UPI00108135C8|nr:hypothetical protein [Paenibacillus cymbidii]
MHAAYHAINDWYTLPDAGVSSPQRRDPERMSRLLDFRWAGRTQGFRSEEHVRQTKRQVSAQLQQFARSHEGAPVPALLFEPMSVRVPQLGIDMSAIVHMAELTEQSYVIHKFVIDESDEFMHASLRQLTLFSFAAFGKLPERIQLIDLLTGNTRCIVPREAEIGQAADYMRFILSVYRQAQADEPSAKLPNGNGFFM